MCIANNIKIELSVRKYNEIRYDYNHYGPFEKSPSSKEPEKCTIFSIHLRRGTKNLDLQKIVFHVF